MRILLVEDDLALGEGIRTALKPEGYTVDWLQDGVSALHALTHESFELVILDLGLPRMDGLQLLKHLRAAANPLPVLTGPTGLAAEMLTHFQQAETLLHAVGRWPKALNLSPRLALQLRLDDGMVVELGRQQVKAPVFQRLTRFVEHYPELLAVGGKRPAVVDMRYPNGFALRFAAASGNEGKGKP